MKRVISGTLYDTEKSTEIAFRKYGYSTDSEHENTALFVTEEGEFFIAGSGGSMSRWARRISQNEWTKGKGLRLLNEAEALRLAEEWGADPKVIAKYFRVEEA